MLLLKYKTLVKKERTKMLLAYKYRIYPTKEDKILLAKHFGLLTFLASGHNHNLSAGTVDYTRGEPSSGDGDSILIVAPSSYGSVKREAPAS